MSKIKKMERQTFLSLTTTSQWILFLAMALVIFSWAEHKKVVQQAGQLLFFMLGIFSLWIILSGKISVPDSLPEQPALLEERMLTYFSGLIIISFLGLIGFILNWRQSSWTRFINLILMPVALFLFFMVYQLQQL